MTGKPSLPERGVAVLSRWLDSRSSRRGFLARAAVVGSALAVNPWGFLLQPQSAYASVCGSGASCDSGWTAMCCTINSGVNQCPPGSFAGGWWKADGAPMCGGGPRYYIDCQAECTGCGCQGSNFCNSDCWDCQPHCASGTCDQRRVCWNVFRYGQCNQQIGCSGPVLCRMISCVPPWEFEACTTVPATDDNTVDQAAPCLTAAWTPIQARYAALGGAGSALSAEVDAEYGIDSGSAQNCLRGVLYAPPAGAAVHYVLQPLQARYAALGLIGGLGWPASDTLTAPDHIGRFNHFTNQASIFYTPATGAWAVTGGIRARWAELGWEESALGYPLADAGPTADGTASWQRFQNGAIFAANGAGIHAVQQAIWEYYSRLGAALLGYPTTDQVAVGTGAYNRFQQGSISTSPASGTHAVYGPILGSWLAAGAESGRLGFPVTDVVELVGGGQRCDFLGGTALWDAQTGIVTLYYPRLPVVHAEVLTAPAPSADPPGSS